MPTSPVRYYLMFSFYFSSKKTLRVFQHITGYLTQLPMHPALLSVMLHRVQAGRAARGEVQVHFPGHRFGFVGFPGGSRACPGCSSPRGSASSTHHPAAEHWCLCVADVPCLGGGTGAASRALGAAPAAWGLCGTAWTSPHGSDHAQAPAASSECPPTRVPPPPALPAPCGQGGGGQERAGFAMGGCQ